MVIAIDFDGTITEKNEFPEVGKIRQEAIKAILQMQAHGHICVLWTCRQGKELKAAVEELKKLGVKMPVNKSPYDTLNPLCRKIIADIYIDDRSYPMCCPGPSIDWNKIMKDII